MGLFEFLLRLRQPLLEGCPESACLVGSPRYRGKVREEEAAEGFTPKSAPLGHKSGMSQREIKINIYGTSTHFFCFPQNRFNCIISTYQYISVLYLRHFSRPGFPIFQRILRQFSITEEDQACLFKFWGSRLSQLF